MAEEPRKRSRFDKTESESRKSRFDRRSRSPSYKKSEHRRSRSPMSRGNESPSNKSDPAAAAAAAAARINAQIQARKGLQHADVPPIRPTTGSGSSKSPSNAPALSGEMYTQDGDYIKDIEINDLRNKYLLTKGATQKMIKEDTGADVTTRGNYYPDKSLATATSPPLYLHVTSITKEGLEKAVTKIEDLMKQELPNLVDERRFRRREPEQVEKDEYGRRKWPEEKIPIDLEPINGFNLRAQVVGHGGANVKYIQQETRCRVQIKGRGSGFIEPSTNRESDEPMYLHVAGPDPKDVQKARELCEGLLENVKSQYDAFKERGPRRHEGGYQNGRGYGEDRERSHGYGGYGGSYGSQNSPSVAPTTSSVSTHNQPSGTPGASSSGDYAAQYAQYYGGQDPYAAYGGYQNYVAMYYSNYYQQQQPQSQQSPGQHSPPPGTVPAPQPPSDEPPPPPPPPGNPHPPPPPPTDPPPGSYGSVPPPPGM